MTETSRPWAGTSTGDAGAYSHINWQDMYELMFGGVANSYSCIIPESGTAGTIPLEVVEDSPASADVRVRAGAALVNGTFYYNDIISDLTISANVSGNARIDTIVLKWDSTAQTVRMVVKEGTPAGSPVAPTLTDTSTVKEIPLADIAVANGFSTITQSNITPRAKPITINHAVLSVLQNNSGADIAHGYMVELDSSNDRSIQVSDDMTDAIGVLWGDAPSGDWAIVCSSGISTVYCDSATTRGEALVYNQSTAGQLTGETHINQFRIGTALETISAAGYCKALIDFSPPHALASYSYKNDTGYTTTSTSLVDMDASNINETIKVTTGKVLCQFSTTISVTTTCTVTFDLQMGGVSKAQYSHSHFTSGGAAFCTINFEVTGITAGNQTFKIQQSTSAGTLTTTSVYFRLQEVY